MTHDVFIRDNFSPLGAQGRARVAPQVFSYLTIDDLSSIKDPDYFPRDSTDPVGNNMLGVFKPNDWIMLNWINIVNPSGPIQFRIIFIDNDGRDGNVITTHAVDIRAT